MRSSVWLPSSTAKPPRHAECDETLAERRADRWAGVYRSSRGKNALYNNLSLISSWTLSTICRTCSRPCTWRYTCILSLTWHYQPYRSTDLPVLPLRHFSAVSCLSPLIPSQLYPRHQLFISFVLFASFELWVPYQYFVLCHDIWRFISPLLDSQKYCIKHNLIFVWL